MCLLVERSHRALSKRKNGGVITRTLIATSRANRIKSVGAAPYKVFSEGDYNVHHKNGIRWDNRPSNIGLVTRSEHSKVHNRERFGDESERPWLDREWLNEWMNGYDIAEEVGCDNTTIYLWIRRYGL